MYRKNMMILVVVVFLSGVLGMAHGEEIVRITNGEWPPFTSAKFQLGGVLSRIVSEPSP